MTPTAELSSCDQKSEHQDSQRPPPHEPQDRQNERHSASPFVNVMNIYINGSRCQALFGVPSPALLGKVARRAGWGVARFFKSGSDCTTVGANRRRSVPAFHTPSAPSVHLPLFAEKGRAPTVTAAPRRRRAPANRPAFALPEVP